MKGNIIVPVFKSHKTIEKNLIWVTNQNRGKHINYKRKTKEQQEHQSATKTNAKYT